MDYNNNESNMNTVSQENIENQSLVSSNKTKKFPIIIITIVCLCVVGGIAFLLSRPKNDLIVSSGKDEDNNILNGKVQLIYTSDAELNLPENYEEKSLVVSYSDDKIRLIDKKGDKHELDVNTTLNNYYKYLGDGLVSYFKNDSLFIYDSNTKKEKEIVKYSYSVDTINLGNLLNFVEYKDGIVYYSNIAICETYAYSLNKNEILWQVKGALYPELSNFVEENQYQVGLGEDVIRLHECGGNLKRGTVGTIIVDFKGNIILDGTQEEDNIRTSFISYYLKSKSDEYVQIYDFDNKLITNMSLSKKNGNRFLLSSYYFKNGSFIVEEYNDKNYLEKATLYDVFGNVLYESNKSISTVAPNNNNELFNPTDNILIKTDINQILLNNGKIIKSFWKAYSKSMTRLKRDYTYYLLTDNYPNNNKSIINLKSLSEFEISNDFSNDFTESPTGNYFILHNDEKYIVYDETFNDIYESNNILKPINDTFVLELNNTDNTMEMINIKTGNKDKIDALGEYIFNSSTFLSTYYNDKYNLYVFK